MINIYSPALIWYHTLFIGLIIAVFMVFLKVNHLFIITLSPSSNPKYRPSLPLVYLHYINVTHYPYL
jgi:hypothetical protein